MPGFLLAHPWDNDIDLTGWWMSEKLDGVRAWWDGRQFLSRQGNVYHAPAWFTAGLPNVPLDGELWLDRKAFQRTVSIVRRHDQSDHWRQIKFVVFDAPALDGPFEDRQKALLRDCPATLRPPYARCSTRTAARAPTPASGTGPGRVAGRRGADAPAAGLAVRGRPLVHVAQGQDVPRRRGPRGRAPAGQGPPCRPAGRGGRRTAQRADVLGGHRLHRRPAAEPAPRRQHDHVPLPGTDRSRRAPVPVVRAGPGGCCVSCRCVGGPCLRNGLRIPNPSTARSSPCHALLRVRRRHVGEVLGDRHQRQRGHGSLRPDRHRRPDADEDFRRRRGGRRTPRS